VSFNADDNTANCVSIDLGQSVPEAMGNTFKTYSKGEAMAPKNRLFVVFLAVALAAAFGFADNASAAKEKITYEEAYQRCKAFLDKEGTPGTSTQANVRYTRGSACMKKYGYKL
jgi:hypothetical protein